MSQVIVNPEELRGFASALDNFTVEIDGAFGKLNSSFNAVDSWRDSQRDSYEEFHNDLKAYIARFNDNAGEKADYLRKKAAEADIYLGI